MFPIYLSALVLCLVIYPTSLQQHHSQQQLPMVAPSKLFTPLKVGNVTLKHRVVLTPLTRYRANKDHVHGDLAVEYYRQRSSTPGTLLITEGTFIAAEAGGYKNVPGIWSEEQITAWKRVTDAVHSNKSFIFLQLWALGRTAKPTVLEEEGGYSLVSSSDVPLTGTTVTPKPLNKDDIKRYVGHFATAASNAIRAGFDGVEIHGANGYLVDQFIQDTANRRTDEYGGSIENRARFPLEVIDAIVAAVGEERTAIRLSPWGQFQDMREKDPISTFSHLIKQIDAKHPNLAYLHFVESLTGDSLDFARKIWQPRPLIVAGGYEPDTAKAVVEEKDGLVAFGRWFIANPDLPVRLEHGLPLNPYDRDTFYLPESPKGYTDYPFAEQQQRVPVQA